MNLWVELKYAWRRSTKSWGYSLMCAGVVAVSVAMTVFVYSATRHYLISLGSNSARWYSVQIAADRSSHPQPRIDAYSYQELLKHKDSTDHLGAFTNHPVALYQGGTSVRLIGALITPRLLAAMRVKPLVGRMFEDADGQPGAAAVAILSFDTWQHHFAADQAVVGKTVRLDEALVQIVGVMPENFRAFRNFELWLPLQMPRLTQPQDPALMLSPLIVVGQHQSIETVLNEMDSAIDALNRRYPSSFTSTRHVTLVPARRMYAHVTPLVMFNSSVAAVLLLGGLNVSMVFLTRLLERSRELALRTALGASRLHLLRQCLLETAYVVVFGFLLGYALAVMVFRWGQGKANFEGQTLGVPPLEMRFEGLAIAVSGAIVIWLLSTLIPAWRASKQDAATVLAGGGKGVLVRASDRKVRILVALQVLISSLALVTCGTLALAVNRKLGRPTGLNTANVMMTDSTALSAQGTASERNFENLTAELESRVPGVEVAFTTMIPTRPKNIPVLIERAHASNKRTKLPRTVVSESYFELLGIGLRSGRLFARTDHGDSPGVAVVDETMAARHWSGLDVIGQRIQLNPSDNGPWLTIIGLVSAVSDNSYRPDVGTLYLPLRQAGPSEFRVLIKVHGTAVDGGDTAFAVDGEMPLRNLQKLDVYFAALRSPEAGLGSIVIVIVFIIALLVITGLLGLIGRSVAQRTQDVGILRALGATRWRATSMFVRQGSLYLCVAVAGVGIGIVVRPVLNAIVDGATDYVVPVGFAVVVFMAVIIGLASYLPCRRALALAPGDALRHD